MRIIAAALLAGLVVSCRPAENPRPPAPSRNTEDVQRTHDRFFSALLSEDTSTLRSLLVDDWELAAGQGHRSKEEFLQLFRAGLTYDSASHSDLRILRYGDTGVVRGRADVWYTLQGRPGKERLHYLAVYQREGSAWRMLAYQSAVGQLK